MKALSLGVVIALSSFSVAHADVCADRAVSAVKNAFSEYFQADSEGLKRVVGYAGCKTSENLKYCKVGTKTLDIGENVWFSVVLDKECTKVVGLKKDSVRDE
jgi:hypothetical protein